MIFENNDIFIKKRKIINRSSFELRDTGIFLLVGENGCGKTLLINNYFEHFIENGIDAILIDQMNDLVLSRESVLGNIAFTNNNKKRESIDESIHKLNLQELCSHDVNKMSGGEKRIVSLLRGILTSSPVVLIDEPTNDLDFENVNLVIKIIKELANKSLILIVTHDDRLINIADGILTIENKRIKSNTIIVNEDFKDSTSSTQITKKISKDQKIFLHRQFSFKYVSILLNIILIIMLLFSLVEIVNECKKTIPKMKENQLDIFSKISTYACEIEDGAIPLSYLKYIDGESNISSFKKEYLRILNEESDKIVGLSLNIPKSSKYEIYYLEFYDVETHSFYDTIQEYLEENGLNFVNTSEFFDLPNKNELLELEEYNNSSDIDIAYFNSICDYDELIENGYSLIYCSLVFKNQSDLFEFLGSDLVKNLARGNYYIKCNETIELVNDCKILISESNNLIFLMVSFALVLLIEIIFTILYLKNNKKQIRLFKNMSYPKKEISKCVFTKSYEIQFRLTSFIIGIVLSFIIAIINYEIIKNNLLIYLLFVFMFFIGNVVVSFVDYLVYAIIMNTYLDWRSR